MPTEGSIVVRVLETHEDMLAIGEAWRALEMQCADPLGYFQSFDWCSNWVRQFGDGSRRPFVVTLWRGSRLVALWPQMIAESAGIRRLETLGSPHSQYCGVLVRPGESSRADIVSQLKAASRSSGCDVVISRAVPEGSLLEALWNDVVPMQGTANCASILDLSGFSSSADYTAQLGKLQKRNRNRRRNHLARLGALEFEVIWPQHPDFRQLVQRCTEMKRRWLSETGRYSVGFSMEGYENFLGGLAGDPARLEGACLSVLRAGKRIVALELGFIAQRHYCAYVGGFDWDLRDLSPGKVQMDLTVGWLIDNGVGAYDLLINPADYKNSWSNRTIAVSTRAEALTWKGRVYASAWLPSIRPALKRLHGVLPQAVQRVANFMRPAVCLLLYV